MKRILIIGAGTAGTMMAVHLSRKLSRKEWVITILDKDENHYYQPGYLFIPFGIYTKKDVIRKGAKYIPSGIEYLLTEAEQIVADQNRVKLKDGHEISYDVLIIATGTNIHPEETQGMMENGWRENIFDFYTADGAEALGKKLADFKGGKVAIHVAEMPIKCPVAPLEIAFLSDWYFAKKGIRKDVAIDFVTPLAGAFSKPATAKVMGHLLKERGINMIADFGTERVDYGKLIGYDSRAVGYDLLITTPTNMGDALMARSGLGDDLNYVPANKNTLQAKAKDNIFALGDATNLPSSKAGSVVHFQSEILTENILSYIKGKELSASFDGHSNCFIESGYGKAFLLDFNYEIDPVEGTYPLPFFGPFSLLRETRLNHIGKLAMKFVYWNILLRGIPVPGISSKMGTAGKKISQA
ncbi:MAG: oxidoreductase [Deltaproteobacteria bacterium HGW-Deltaproteobacteria-2]|jgi:sulfide:quinone oxidoreductase|nr:MAG: oxidoreductase [Deltaproteobacteria bacterium HGW-Deltaproteobacteria-2]